MKIIAIGGSVTGLAAAAALSDRGHEVLILEREAAEPPSTLDEAAAWPRPTVPQAAHSHAFGSRGTNILREKLPDVYDALVEAGAGEVNLADFTPPTLGPVTRIPSDDLLNMLTVRRSTFEWVLRRQVLARAGVRSRTGATVRGLLTDGDRVTGVRLDGGEELTADLVLDASGRKTKSAEWLAEAGLPVPEAQSESCRITYYTRYYRRLTPAPPGPLNRGFGAGGMWDSYTAVLFLGEGDTFSISIGVLPDDKPMKSLRDEAAFTAAIQVTPLLAGWIAPGNSEPISPVYAMGGLDNSSRFVDPGAPRLTVGFYALGDAVCTTNPANGRGVSLALAHVYELADLLDAHPSVDRGQAARFAGATKGLLAPWLGEAIANDRGRAGLWEAVAAGQRPQLPPPGVVHFGAAVAASISDVEVWRRVAHVMMSLTSPAELYANEEMARRIGRALAGGPPPQLPGASRAELTAALAAAATRAEAA
ncbi:NAD(P)/FAD-dependent oxidoreductase [Actinophytocola sp.]|uniref:NAD(P)/FAD-dependent oxidoreductase n=1 Tax=Actinophytocola sp. TaxID=1872138 RepID=UPI003899930D